MKEVKVGNIIIGKGTPKICVPMVGRTEEALLEEAKAIREEKPDLAEWRCDCFEDVGAERTVLCQMDKIKNILQEIPLLFTFRTKKEGGKKEISFQDYARLNELAAKSQIPELVDIEIIWKEKDTPVTQLVEKIRNLGAKVIASNHDFDKTPSFSQMLSILVKMDERGADILKLAVMPHTSEDVLRLLKVTDEMKRLTEKPVITMSMGGMGVLSRISGGFFGSAVTFASLNQASAPGQIPVKELKVLLKQLDKFSHSVEKNF